MPRERRCLAQLPVLAFVLCLSYSCLISCRDIVAHSSREGATSHGAKRTKTKRWDPEYIVALRREMHHALYETDTPGAEATRDAYRSGAVRRTADATVAPMRFGTMYDDLSNATPEQAQELQNGTMPWVVSTLSRMFQIKNPVDDMKILPSVSRPCAVFIAPNAPLPGGSVPAWICFESPNGTNTNSNADSTPLDGDYYAPVYVCPASLNTNAFSTNDLSACEDLSGPKPVVPLDMVLRISTTCEPSNSNDGTIAYSQPLDFDNRPDGNKISQSWRPAVATVVLCPLYFNLTAAAKMQTLTHELMHGLGFGTLLPIAQNVVGTNQQYDLYPTSTSVSQVTQQVNLRGRTRTLATSQRVVEEAQIQLGCADLVGAELESTGGEGTSLGHLAKRIFTGDLMVGYAPVPSNLEDLADQLDLPDNTSFTANLLVMSRVELALMEDLGYYVPNYAEAGFLRFGYKGGCDFAEDDCSAWEAAHPSQDYFCPLPTGAQASSAAAAEANYKQVLQSTSDVNSVVAASIEYLMAATTCNADRSAIGDCVKSTLSTGEQCPVMQNSFGCSAPVFDQLIEGFDQSSVPNLVASGPDSRCILMSNVSLANVIVGPTIEGGTYSGATCLNMRCANNQLVVTIGSTDFNCPSGGTFDLSTLPFNPPFSRGSLVYCPSYDEMCSTDPSPNAAADFGEVTCDAEAQCNSNGDCYKGVCYCKAGWTGCDCSMLTSDPAAASFNATTCQRWPSLSTEALNIGSAPLPNTPPLVGTESSKSAARGLSTRLLSLLAVLLAALPLAA